MAPADINVQVLNGSTVEGLASSASDDLDKAGYTIAAAPGNDDQHRRDRRPSSATTREWNTSAKTLAGCLPRCNPRGGRRPRRQPSRSSSAPSTPKPAAGAGGQAGHRAWLAHRRRRHLRLSATSPASASRAISSRRASRCCRRICASASRRRSSSLSASTGGTGRGSPLVVDSDEHQVGRGHVHGRVDLVPPLRGDPDPDLHRRTSRPVHLGVGVDQVTDPYRPEEDHLVHGDRDRRAPAVASGRSAGHRVDHPHHDTTVHGAEQVDVERGHDLGQGRACGAEREPAPCGHPSTGSLACDRTGPAADRALDATRRERSLRPLSRRAASASGSALLATCPRSTARGRCCWCPFPLGTFSATPSWLSLLLLVAWLAAYLTSYFALRWCKTRTLRASRSSLPHPRARLRSRARASPVLHWSSLEPWLLAAALAFVPFEAVAAALALQGKERSLAAGSRLGHRGQPHGAGGLPACRRRRPSVWRSRCSPCPGWPSPVRCCT